MMTTMMHNKKNCNNKQTQNDKNEKWQIKTMCILERKKNETKNIKKAHKKINSKLLHEA
jgi:DNA-binding HxlR family transcriptional regulator